MSTQNTQPTPKVEVRNLDRWLGTGEARNHVLRGLNLTLQPGKMYAIVGPSGCGKSTLLYLLGLLDRPDAGEIWIAGKRMDNASETLRTRARCEHIGFVFQFHFLLTEFSALENVMLPMQRMGQGTLESYQERAAELLRQVGLDGKFHRKGNQLSGGEQQRVAVARALANRPELVLADEPTGNLDARNSEHLFQLLRQVSQETGQTMLMVSHNRELAARCDVVLEMRDGIFCEQS